MEKFTREGHGLVTFFVGPEIEQTPAFGKKTLFVVGLQDFETIVEYAKEHKTPHIFLSANRSFDSVDDVNGRYMVGKDPASDWEVLIHKLLGSGYMVSIDYPAHKHAMVLKIFGQQIWTNRNFIPILSVQIPHVSTSSNNLTIKIDDINFKATNPGVWCYNHHELTDNNRFTSWDEYANDVVIDEKATPMPPYVEPPKAPAKKIDLKSLKPVEIEPAAGEAAPGTDMNPQDLGLDTETKTTPEVAQILSTSSTTPVKDMAEVYAQTTDKPKRAQKKSNE